MLIKKRYSILDIVIWTRFQIMLFFIYAFGVTTLYHLFDLKALHVPWTPVALIGTAVAFLIAFQNSAAYDRIWEARKIWGGIVNTSRTWGMKVQDFIRPPSDEISKDEIKKVHRTLIYRHIAWLTALRHALREPKPWEINGLERTNREWSDRICIPESVNTLQFDLNNYLPLSELDYVMSKTNKASTILYLQSKHLRKLKEEGILWEFAFLDLEAVLQEFFSLQGKAERIKNFPYPRQYASISHLFIWMFIFLLPFGIIPEFAEIAAGLEAFSPSIADQFIWVAVPFCAGVSWVFHTMERIGRVGENPFEGSPNDVPISTIARGIEIDIREQLNDPQNLIPQQFPVEHDVQM